jgi:uncharacterized protein (TIGR02001 family)
MKKLLTASIAAATIAGFATPASAVEGLSANVGFVSDYYFRGMNLGDAGAYAGIDYEIGGFYVGSWIIDDGGAGNDGLETDFYLGYGMDIAEDFSFYAGVTSYQYTSTSNHENEFNLGFGFPLGFALDIAVGEDVDSAGNADDVETDYTFMAASWGGEVFGATLGYYKNDGDKDDGVAESEYKYFEVSAGGEVAGLDMAISYGRVFGAEETDLNTKVNTEYASDGTDYLVLDISKSFDL